MPPAMPSPALADAPKPVDPFLPFTRPTIDDATIAGVAEVLRSGWLSSGPQVKAFEARLSEFFGGRPVRAFNSGTCTMEIALRIAGVKAGDEVITTPLVLGRHEQRGPGGRRQARLRGHRPGNPDH